MPNLARLAERAEVGRATVIPPGLPPGSDVGNLAILGYDPVEFHTGRAPIEAAAMGVEVGPDQVAFRCNLVTIDDNVMVDFAGGHPPDDQSHPIMAAVDAQLGDGRWGVRFHPGVEYRHLCVTPAAWGDAVCVPPHDLTGQVVEWPTGRAAPRLRAVMDTSRSIVRDAAAAVGSSANQIWLWGQGVSPTLPPFAERFGVTGRLSSAVDLVRGLGVLAGLEVVDVPGATAGFDNDYAAQTRACLTSLADRDFFLLHVEATDEAGHQGDVAAKVGALEHWDRDVIGPLVTRVGRRAAPDPPAARPRDPVRRVARTSRTRSHTCSPTPSSPGRAGPTPRPRWRTATRSPPITSCSASSRNPAGLPSVEIHHLRSAGSGVHRPPGTGSACSPAPRPRPHQRRRDDAATPPRHPDRASRCCRAPAAARYIDVVPPPRSERQHRPCLSPGPGVGVHWGCAPRTVPRSPLVRCPVPTGAASQRRAVRSAPAVPPNWFPTGKETTANEHAGARPLDARRQGPGGAARHRRCDGRESPHSDAQSRTHRRDPRRSRGQCRARRQRRGGRRRHARRSGRRGAAHRALGPSLRARPGPGGRAPRGGGGALEPRRGRH